MWRDEGNNKSGTTYQMSLPIDRIPARTEPAAPPTEQMIRRSLEMARQSLPEDLFQIKFHLGVATENLANAQEALANIDLRLKDNASAITRLMGMPQTSAVQAKLDAALQIKEAGVESRQVWIKEVGKFTNLSKQWQDRFDAFDHQGLTELRAEEAALAGL